MKCSEVRAFLSQVSYREGSGSITPIPTSDIDYLSTTGYVLKTTKVDYDKGVEDVAKLSQLTTEMSAKKAETEQSVVTLQKDERKEHSLAFHFEGKEAQAELGQKVQDETALVSREESELSALEASVNELIQRKSEIDGMQPYDGGYLSLTGLGTLVLNDLNVRNYRVADQEFPDFITEVKAVYAELRSITDKASSDIIRIRSEIPDLNDEEPARMNYDAAGYPSVEAPSLFWSTAIGLAKLQGDANQIGDSFVHAFNDLQNFDSTIPNKLMTAEIMTALRGQDLQSLESTLENLNHQIRDQGVPKEISVGVAATIMAGRRYDGTYPLDRFGQFKQITASYEAASMLAVMNVPYEDLRAKFQSFREMFTGWGFIESEDVEIASAFLAIGELNQNEVFEKLKVIIEQLHNYLEYPLVAAAILASIPVFEAHETLDLMEKAVTLLSGYARGLERSEWVALAVRVIHGVRNELVREIDPTAKVAETPVQFTYTPHAGFFSWYYPSVMAHSYYHSTFSGMGGFHPAHSHGVGGFAG